MTPVKRWVGQPARQLSICVARLEAREEGGLRRLASLLELR